MTLASQIPQGFKPPPRTSPAEGRQGGPPLYCLPTIHSLGVRPPEARADVGGASDPTLTHRLAFSRLGQAGENFKSDISDLSKGFQPFAVSRSEHDDLSCVPRHVDEHDRGAFQHAGKSEQGSGNVAR